MVEGREAAGNDANAPQDAAPVAQSESSRPQGTASSSKEESFFSGSFDWLKRLRPWVKEDNSWAKVKARPYSMIDAETYIEERFNPMIKWYDAKAVWAKRRYLRVQATTVVGGALVPVLVNVSPALPANAADTSLLSFELLLRGGTTVISILVVILVALEGVLHYREQWVNYRSTEQFMRKEYYLFITQQGSYKRRAGGSDGENGALQLFVERIEQALASENSSTLQILTSTSDASTKEAIAADRVPTPDKPGRPPAGDTAEA